MRVLLLSLVLLQTGCAYSQRGSDEWWFNKMQRDTRSHCNELPDQVKAQCIEQTKKSYDDYVKRQQHDEHQTGSQGQK